MTKINSQIINVSDQTFKAKVENATLPVLVDFWAEWCGPCKQIAPILAQLAHQYQGKIKMVKLNIEENPAMPAKFNIRAIPTLLIFKNGINVANKVGGTSKTILAKWIEENL